MEGNGVRVARLREYLAADSGNSDLACELVDLLLAQGAVGDADAVLSGLQPPRSPTRRLPSGGRAARWPVAAMHRPRTNCRR